MGESVKKTKAAEKLLTEVELELMTILWKKGEGSVADVIEGLPKDRNLAYTSVSTILRILEQKGALKTRKEGRGHVYIPALKKYRHIVSRNPSFIMHQVGAMNDQVI